MKGYHFLISVLCLQSVMLLPMAESADDQTEIERKWQKLQKIVYSGSLRRFQKYEAVLPQLNHYQIGALKSLCENYGAACAGMHDIVRVPGLKKCLRIMEQEAKKLPLFSAYHFQLEAYIQEERKQLARDKGQDKAVDPLRERALGVLELKKCMQINSYMKEIKKKMHKWPRSKKENYITQEVERIAVIRPIIDRECALWIHDTMWLDEKYGAVHVSFRKLKPGEQYTLPPWPGSREYQEPVEKGEPS